MYFCFTGLACKVYRRISHSTSLRFHQTLNLSRKSSAQMESIHQNLQTFPVKNPRDAQDFAHGFKAKYKKYRQAAGWVGSRFVKKQIPSSNVYYESIFLSADGVFRNRSISTIKNRQLGSTPHQYYFFSGKAKASYEFGVKISLTRGNRFIMVHGSRFENFIEKGDLIDQIHKYLCCKGHWSE